MSWGDIFWALKIYHGKLKANRSEPTVRHALKYVLWLLRRDFPGVEEPIGGVPAGSAIGEDLDQITADLESARDRLVQMLRVDPDQREINVARVCVDDALEFVDDQRKAWRNKKEKRK